MVLDRKRFVDFRHSADSADSLEEDAESARCRAKVVASN